MLMTFFVLADAISDDAILIYGDLWKRTKHLAVMIRLNAHHQWCWNFFMDCRVRMEGRERNLRWHVVVTLFKDSNLDTYEQIPFASNTYLSINNTDTDHEYYSYKY